MYNEYKDNLPYKLLRLGLACNAKCLFCNVPQETYPGYTDIAFARIKNQINDLIKQNIDIRLSITGGEPTLRSDLTDIISWVKQRGVKTLELQTNGILLARKPYVKKLKKSGLTKIFVGLHAPIANVHDALMRKKGAFNACTAGIKNALECGIEVTLNPVLTTYNYACFPDYIHFICNTFPQIRYISLSVVQPRGRAWLNKPLVPRYGTIDRHVKKGLSLAKKSRIIINNPYCGLPLCIGGWHRYLNQCVEYCENLLRKKGMLLQKSLNLEKIKAKTCAFCKLSCYCNGVWKEYAYIHPLCDLKPVK